MLDAGIARSEIYRDFGLDLSLRLSAQRLGLDLTEIRNLLEIIGLVFFEYMRFHI